MQNVNSRQNIFMVETAQHFEFTIDTTARNQTLENIRQFLHSNTPTIAWITDSPDDTKSTTADRLLRFGRRQLWHLKIRGHQGSGGRWCDMMEQRRKSRRLIVLLLMVMLLLRQRSRLER
jgi:hypothetical protein